MAMRSARPDEPAVDELPNSASDLAGRMPGPQTERVARYASRILLALRNGRATNWPSLCTALGLGRHRLDSGTLPVLDGLQALERAGLVSWSQASKDRFEAPTGDIRLTERWTQLQKNLGLSLTELARLERPNATALAPLFHKALNVPHRDVFVLMPFGGNLDAVYREHIIPVVRGHSLSIARADDLFTNHAIMDDIWTSILRSRIVVADCTGRNPNVFYELGVAHTVGKPVILLTQSTQDVPFDISHIRYIKYQYTPPGMVQFEEKLSNTLKSMLVRDPGADDMRPHP